MVFACVVHGCRKRSEPYVRTLHGFPDNLETINAWNEFVKRTKPKWNGTTPSSRICSEHFQPACYKNHMAWSMGWVRTLELIDDFQVPTIYPAVKRKSAASTTNNAGRKKNPNSSASSTMPAPMETRKDGPHCSAATKKDHFQECRVKAEYQVMYVVRHVASQTDPPPESPSTRSVGTQLTRKYNFRSTGSQVKFMSRDCGVCTEPLNSPMLLLQPTLVKRPSKKLRLTLEDEGAPSESIKSTAVQDQNNST
ncbi:THAP domain-containing protein 10-like [Girardinichthys multiradiatus]|uniref:THAP domain-containing protein 10-like n=1 Tax=Girardinichthys multiradiatus TaxID=208333 RepID=UPI001FAC59B4|nr:THAP domain-containing protein 10-like [Girardinichthys multiradiatus]